MKLLILGDLHLRTKTPERRTEADFKAVCLGKLEQVLNLAATHHCNAILQPGDFFDSPNPGGELLADVIRMVLRHLHDGCPPILAVHGQHDLAYHTEASTRRSPLRVMEAAGAVRLLSDGPYRTNGCSIYGADFGQDPVNPLGSSNNFRALVAHTMVGDKPLWPGHDLTGPEDYVRKHLGFDLYVLGDYHYPWIWLEKDIVAVNVGTMVRKAATERELVHQPKIGIFDTHQKELEYIRLKVSPSNVAFDLTERKDDRARQFDAFTAKLREQGKVGVDFAGNLRAFFEANKTPKPVRGIIWKAMEGASS